MTIGILLCGDIPAALHAEFGSYSTMIRGLLGSRSATVFDVQKGQLPESTSACEAYAISGSNAGVYDALPWIKDLVGFLRNARAGSKLIGICFGHQAMAQAFGGSVIKSPKGWGIGLHRYDLPARPHWMDDATAVAAPASHQDQVVTLPPDARVIASNEFTPHAGLDYGDAISFQFHPEFSRAFAAALIEARRERYADLAASAIQSHSQPDDCARVGRWIGRFLDSGEAAPVL
ncbi:MAG TPA: type 1 glutamine amidotransferase [Roseiarcus sp.]|jgi:GMP synthase-like glutamine amidotransferase